MSETLNPALHRFALFTSACTCLLLVAGALVTSNDAGLAVPDWPLSYGSLLPPMVGGILFEHGHRMVATFVGLLTIVLAIWLTHSEPRRWVRRFGWAALAAVVLQGVLGGLTVLFFLPHAVSIAHAALAQIFFCITVTLALVTSPWWHSTSAVQEDSASTPVREFSVVVVVAVFIQLLLGAAYRHHALTILPHLVWAVVVAAVSWGGARWVLHRLGHIIALRRAARILSALVAAQLVLGAAAYWSRVVSRDFPQPVPLMIVVTVAHVLAGALTLASAVVLLLCCYRVLRPAHTSEIAKMVAHMLAHVEATFGRPRTR